MDEEYENAIDDTSKYIHDLGTVKYCPQCGERSAYQKVDYWKCLSCLLMFKLDVI